MLTILLEEEINVNKYLYASTYLIFFESLSWKFFKKYWSFWRVLDAHILVEAEGNRKIRYIDFCIRSLKACMRTSHPLRETKRAPICCATIKISLKLKLEDWFIFYVFTCYSLEAVQWSEDWYLITFNNENIPAINEKVLAWIHPFLNLSSLWATTLNYESTMLNLKLYRDLIHHSFHLSRLCYPMNPYLENKYFEITF